MFGIGFTEFLVIFIVAILFLGPDKLPTAFMEVAKFIKGVKSTIAETKASLEEELKISDLKEEALKYKRELDEATDELKSFKNIDFDSLDDISYDKPSKKSDPYVNSPTEHTDETVSTTTQLEEKNDVVTFRKKSKLDKEEDKEVKDV